MSFGPLVSVEALAASAPSVRLIDARPGAAAYAASKAGVISLVRTLARDHGPDGVRVVAVSPGIIETPMLEAAIAVAPDPEAYAAVQAALQQAH